MTVFVRAEIRAHPDRVDDVRRLAGELADAAGTEPGTLRYDWFAGTRDDTFVVLEEYVDPLAAVAHNEHCAELLTAIGAVSDMVSVALHGELDEALAAFVDAHPRATAHPPL